ncbi:cupin domain-containing protein [Psychromonas sp. psych-6C06]|uniref:cupin domain-containing protein n=1 Tax=Psychromonas sp. psych-6C06 TaxID=2058089 RepID=UPI000C34F20E|nr:cupin domain-containing protein [Psychromonas sp. psych-6C06]PKF60737.1 cupin domain-containing protein [Psychromonas sp. psych-6C06]
MDIIEKSTAIHYQWGDNCDGWHLVKSKQLSVIQERMLAGCCESNHYHQNAEQFFYIISGLATMKLKNKTLTLKAGEGVHIEAGTAHQLCNESEHELNFIVTSAPPSHGDKQEI